MGLKDLQLPKSPVETPGGSFTVRGISTVEIELMFREHRATFTALFDQFSETAKAGDDDLMSIAGLVLTAAPELVGRIIAIASDEPDAVQEAMRLTPAIQIRALALIAGLTFTVEGDLGKMMGNSAGQLANLNQLLDSVVGLLGGIKTL